MIKVLLDTDVIIECLRGNQPILNSLHHLSEQGSVIHYSTISKAEIYCGIRPSEEHATGEFFRQMESLPVDESVAETAGRYQNRFRKSHNVDLGDAIIAATAHVHHLLLYTFNLRHYPMNDIEFFGV